MKVTKQRVKRAQEPLVVVVLVTKLLCIAVVHHIFGEEALNGGAFIQDRTGQKN